MDTKITSCLWRREVWRGELRWGALKDKPGPTGTCCNVEFTWADNIGRDCRALCTKGRGTEGVRYCVDNKEAMKGKGQAVIWRDGNWQIVDNFNVSLKDMEQQTGSK